MSELDFCHAFVELAVYDAARAIAGKFDYYHPDVPCQRALDLITSGRPGDSPLIDVMAVQVGMEPVELYQVLHRRALGVCVVIGTEGKVRTGHPPSAATRLKLSETMKRVRAEQKARKLLAAS